MLLQKPLSPEEKAIVYDRIREGDAKARKVIVWTHGYYYLRLARRNARHYQLGDVAVDDLLQECFIRALKVVGNFNPDIADFSTFIRIQLRPVIDKYASDCLQIPVKLLSGRAKIRRAIKLQQARGIVPSPASISSEFGFSVSHVSAVLEGGGLISPLRSISEPVGDGSDGGKLTLGDLFVSGEPSAFDQLITAERSTHLQEALACLSDRERFVMTCRFFEDQTFEQISTVLLITRERVRQIEVIALEKLMKFMQRKRLQFADLVAG